MFDITIRFCMYQLKRCTFFNSKNDCRNKSNNYLQPFETITITTRATTRVTKQHEQQEQQQQPSSSSSASLG